MAAPQLKTSKSENIFSPSIKATNTNLDPNFITISNQKDFPYIVKRCRNRLLVVEFFAKWCGPCQILTTKLEELGKSYEGRVLIVKVDVDEFEDLAAEFNILAIPTFVIMRNRKKLLQFFSSDEQTLEKNLEKYAGKPIFKAIKKPKVSQSI